MLEALHHTMPTYQNDQPLKFNMQKDTQCIFIVLYFPQDGAVHNKESEYEHLYIQILGI